MTQFLDAVYEAGTIRLIGQPSPSLAEGQRVKVMVENEPDTEERESWLRLRLESLARAYGDDEPEYLLDDLKEVNPHYARG
jgi:hypothetical protein